jgi:hypothetical protein
MSKKRPRTPIGEESMNQDIDAALNGWEYKPGIVQARLVEAGDGRNVLQLRVDLGLLQMETTHRPDGTQPHGFPTYHVYLAKQAQLSARSGRTFVLNEEQCQEADREFVQYYHRRLCWLALHQYAHAVADADHTLAFMDFVRDHSPSDEFTQAHEQYRGFVEFQRTQAAGALCVEKDDPEGAIDAINEGLEKLRKFFATYDLEDQFEENGMVQQLRKMAGSLRKTHNIESTLQEQLNDAVANEEYETAARLRDELKRRK